MNEEDIEFGKALEGIISVSLIGGSGIDGSNFVVERRTPNGDRLYEVFTLNEGVKTLDENGNEKERGITSYSHEVVDAADYVDFLSRRVADDKAEMDHLREQK